MRKRDSALAGNTDGAGSSHAWRKTCDVRTTPQFPPKEANTTNMLKYASYIVEKGAKLVFTDNPDYPESLIERR